MLVLVLVLVLVVVLVVVLVGRERRRDGAVGVVVEVMVAARKDGRQRDSMGMRRQRRGVRHSRDAEAGGTRGRAFGPSRTG